MQLGVAASTRPCVDGAAGAEASSSDTEKEGEGEQAQEEEERAGVISDDRFTQGVQNVRTISSSIRFHIHGLSSVIPVVSIL